LIQAALRSVGAPTYTVPSESERRDLEFCGLEVGGYGALHVLRRYAVHAMTGHTPPDGAADASKDAALRACYKVEPIEKVRGVYVYPAPVRKSLWRSLLGQKHASGVEVPSPHLINHSDADGFYLPVDFASPFLVRRRNDNGSDDYVSVGSSVRLLAELDRLAAHLQLPPDIDPESLEFDHVVPHREPWRRHVAAGRVCAVLRQLARQSMDYRAMIVFC
jgi:hypothetical protein